MQELHIFYSGDVQGVGFRYIAKRVADALGVTGWVRNLPTGEVELLMQGDEKVLSQMKNELNNQFYINTTRIDQTKSEVNEKLNSFKII